MSAQLPAPSAFSGPTLFPYALPRAESSSADCPAMLCLPPAWADQVWSPQDVCDELHKLRSHDDEADLQEEAELFRMEQLSLQPIYAKPPPAWLHPAVAAEFGDPFIGGTALENGEMHVSLEVSIVHRVIESEAQVRHRAVVYGTPRPSRASMRRR